MKHALLTALCLGLVLLGSSCTPPGGCDAMDHSYSIALQEDASNINLPANLIAPADYLREIVHTAPHVIGYVADQDCSYVYYTDFSQFAASYNAFAISHQFGGWTTSTAVEGASYTGTLELNGDIATETIDLQHVTPYGEAPARLTAFHGTATFNATDAQAAMNQIFKGHKGGQPLPLEQLLPVTVHWHVEATIDGAALTDDLDVVTRLLQFQQFPPPA